MSYIRVETVQDIDGVWRSQTLTQPGAAGEQVERFEGALVGENRPPALNDVIAYMKEQGYEVVNELPTAKTFVPPGGAYTVILKPKPALTVTQRIEADIRAVKAGAKPTEEFISADDQAARDANFKRLRRGV
jgi:hypothetical protein